MHRWLFLMIMLPCIAFAWVKQPAAENVRKEILSLDIEALQIQSKEHKLKSIRLLLKTAGDLADSLDPFKGMNGPEILKELKNWQKQTESRASVPIADPSIVLVMCEDNRLDEDRILGFSGGAAYLIRVAGGLPISQHVIESIKLPFEQKLKSQADGQTGVRLVLFLSHDKCGQQRICDIATGDKELRAKYSECSVCKLDAERVKMLILANQDLRELASSGQVTFAYGQINTDTLKWEVKREFTPKDFK